MKKEKNSKGFSLIELIIAIAILVILTGLLAPQFMRYMEKSREAKDMQVLDTIYSAVQVALTNEKAYEEITTSVELSALRKEGINLSKLSNNIDKGLVFQSEFYGVLGVSENRLERQKFSPWTSRAVKEANAVKDYPDDPTMPFCGSAVYIQVDKNMKTTVWIGKAATEIDDKGRKEYPVTDAEVLNGTTKVDGLGNVLTAGTKFIISK